MAAGLVKHGKRHAACVLLLMALWYHPAFSRERNLPVIPYPAEVRMDGRGVYDMERSSWWIDPEADSLCVKAVERFFAGVAHGTLASLRNALEYLVDMYPLVPAYSKGSAVHETYASTFSEQHLLDE